MIGRYKILVHKANPQLFGQWHGRTISVRNTPDPMDESVTEKQIERYIGDLFDNHPLNDFDLITVEIKKV